MSRNHRKDKETVVVIDDDEAARLSVGQMLRLRGYRSLVFDSAESALARPELEHADCVVTDVKMPGMGGEAFLAECADRGFTSPIIMITGHGDISMAVRCLKAGAYDFVEKPFEDEVLVASVSRACENTALRRESWELRRRLERLEPAQDGRHGMVGRSKPMCDLYAQIEAVAKSSAPVLVVGETGSGKELVARAIHELSPFSAGPFVPVNAGALPETMLESELFGHAKGAFTGAVSDRDGKLLTASGGTLLLDEVECLSLRAQVELLRVIEDGLVQPLGRDIPRKVSIRLLVATNTDLLAEVGRGRMREDFYHRVMVLAVTVPSLRERPDDIPLLLSFFLKQAADRNSLPIPEIPEKTLADMLCYTWPGNVRELKNVAERMVITAQSGIAGQFTPEESSEATKLLSLPAGQGRLRSELEQTERTVIEAALREQWGEINSTCQSLGISRRALYERMKKYGLDKKDFRA
jgi:two-component system C4-dicarboxylate transport response regulator DctD